MSWYRGKDEFLFRFFLYVVLVLDEDVKPLIWMELELWVKASLDVVFVLEVLVLEVGCLPEA